MQVYVARPSDHASIQPQVVALFDKQREPRHTAVDDPEAADIVLFVDCHLYDADWRYDWIAGSEVARRFPEKVTVYDERDRPWCRYPGIYVSMPAACFHPEAQVAAPYWSIPDAEPEARIDDADLLFSFVGSPSVRCRERIYRLSHPDAVIEKVTGFTFFDPESEGFDARKRRFADVMGRSRFVLCPRGRGVSSIRLYEVMAAGRVPVVIADDWVPPRGPDWPEFSLVWREDDVASLPGALESLADRAPEMGRKARRAYLDWIAEDVWLTRHLDQFEALRRMDGFPHSPAEFRDGAFRNARAEQTQRALRYRAGKARDRVLGRGSGR